MSSAKSAPGPRTGVGRTVIQCPVGSRPVCLYGEGCLQRLVDDDHNDEYVHSKSSLLPRCNSDPDCELYILARDHIMNGGENTLQMLEAQEHVEITSHAPIHRVPSNFATGVKDRKYRNRSISVSTPSSLLSMTKSSERDISVAKGGTPIEWLRFGTNEVGRPLDDTNEVGRNGPPIGGRSSDDLIKGGSPHKYASSESADSIDTAHTSTIASADEKTIRGTSRSPSRRIIDEIPRLDFGKATAKSTPTSPIGSPMTSLTPEGKGRPLSEWTSSSTPDLGRKPRSKRDVSLGARPLNDQKITTESSSPGRSILSPSGGRGVVGMKTRKHKGRSEERAEQSHSARSEPTPGRGERVVIRNDAIKSLKQEVNDANIVIKTLVDEINKLTQRFTALESQLVDTKKDVINLRDLLIEYCLV